MDKANQNEVPIDRLYNEARRNSTNNAQKDIFFCDICGEKLDLAQTYCHKCGAPNPFADPESDNTLSGADIVTCTTIEKAATGPRRIVRPTEKDSTSVPNSTPLQGASHLSQVNQSMSPQFGEFLLCLFLVCSKEERESILGDLQEEYTWFLLKFGKTKAKIWYYKQVYTSIRPFLRRILLKWTILTGIGEWIRRLIH